MALLLSKKLPTGVVAEYIRITAINLDLDKNRSVVDYEIYLNAEEREKGSKPVATDRLAVESVLSDIVKDQILTAVYTGAKQTEKLTGAVDAVDVDPPVEVDNPVGPGPVVIKPPVQ